MRHPLSYLGRLLRSQRGSSALEFAFGAPAMVVMLAGILETGMIMFTSTLMEGALRDASRYGVTGQEPDPAVRLQNIVNIVSSRTIGLVDMSQATVDVLVYPGFSDVGQGEDFIDGNSNGSYDAGETFTDDNSNGTWDADKGTAGPGGSGEIVLYRLSYDWPLLTPIVGHFVGQDGKIPVTASIVVRNEPWEDDPGAGT